MPNTIAPFGFRPIRRFDGAAWTSTFTQIKMAANSPAVNRGDCVTMDLTTGMVKLSAPGDHPNLRGVFVGCRYLMAALGYPIWTNYWPGAGATAGTLVDAFVMDDPNVVYEVQASAGPITQADLGKNADIIVQASTTGFSKWALGPPSTGTGADTLPFKILSLGNMSYPISDGYDATSANNIVEVVPNEWFLSVR